MKSKILILTSAVIIALLACQVFANETYHYYVPTYCTPPTPPSPGQPGYGVESPLVNGIYWDYNAGSWVIPDAYWNPDGNSSDRDYQIAALIESVLPPPPSRPSWAIFDMESNGTYYWGGGYYNGHYFAEGFYLPNEIW